MKTVTTIDYVVIAAYMVLMVGIGLYAARFNRNASDYFRGANRIPWLVAGLSSFMSGFSAWTFTGAAGLAYQKGVVAILLYLGNALTFLLGYWIFAVRWRRARTSTVMEYLVGRFDERTRQAFSWSTVLFQLFTGASMLYGLGLFVASTCDLPLVWTILGSGLVILAYCVVGGLWAVVITDFLQAAILMPFTLVMLVVSLSRVGGVGGLVRGLPPELTSLHLTSEMGWLYVASWTVMVSFGYNTSAMAQRYFSVDDERSAKKVALLCFVLFVVGAIIWFVPPLTMRVLYPDLRAVWPGLANPHEASYAVASLTLLPNGLVGIMLAAMFSATMSSLSGLFNVHAAVVSKDIYQRLVAPQASERHLLTVGWIATFGVGAAMTALAMGMAAKGQSVFQVMLTFNTIISLAYGPPALLGLVVKRTPAWSGLLSFAVGLALGCYGAFVGHWSLVKNVLVILPTSMLVFLATSLVRDGDPAHLARREALFTRLATPVDVARELQGSVDPTATVFRFLSRATAGVGGLSLLLLPWAPPGERGTVVLFAAVTLLLAAGLTRIGRTRAPVLLALLTVVLGPAAAQAGVARVWAVSDGERVEQDDLASPLRARNGAWDGTRTRIFGARNEVLAFQVMVESDAQGIQRLGVALPELRQRGGAARIAYAPPGPDPSQSVGRPIQVFAVHYMNVTETTHADWAWKPGSAAAPRDTLGWKPVQLVPENARADRGGLPVRVAPSRNQALWIEIYTPRDLPAGLYDGVVTVTADGRAHRVPLELQVFGFTLPDANSLDVMVYYEPSQPELYHGRTLDDVYHRFAHRHRVELVHAYDEVAVRAGKGRFDGSDFTKATGYEGPGEAVGNRIVPRSFYGPGRGWDDRPTAWRQADAWMSFMERELPGARTFLYMPDEPSPAEYPEIRTLAENVHSNPGAGKRLPVFVTKRWVPELDDSIDFWCTGPQGFDIARAAREKARGRNYCFYNGGRPDGPSPLIDAPATEARAVAWAAFKHDVDLYFFWHGVHWLHNRQKQGERRQNVWANPITFDNRGQPNKDDHGYLNGDGVLFYPGEEKVHPEEDRGVAGPVATVQLANLRRGLQDHQYLTLARKLGRTAAVDAALRAVVPRVFSDAGDTVGFAETGEVYDAARLALAQAIVSASERGAPGGLGGPYPPRLKSAAEFTSAARMVPRPRLLVAERDPFSGLPALKARYAAGARPSDDLPGWALGYLLSGDEALARRAVEYMRTSHPPTKGGSSLYLEYLKWSLAFDWLYGWPGFDAALKDRVAGELVAGAERVLALQSLADPAQASYHNHTVRELATAVFPLAAVEGHPSVEARAAPLRARSARALDNILETTNLVNPEGGYHESMDYMRITWAPLALMAELRRTTTGEDPARRYGVFQSMGPTYLYKVLPDGSTARDDDNEFPHLDAVDNVVLGYAVHRFKDPFAAWMLRKREWLPAAWRIPVLEFLWHDDRVAPRDPATTTPAELPRERRFPGIGHVVLRDGWGPDSTWIEFSSGPYFAKHDHLDTNHFAIYRKGHLAVDAGADYTDTESPHYLNHYRRTVAHNTMLVYQPGESFFWGENKWAAANDGGQRMDSSRFWNSVRSLEDWRHTRDLWDRGRIAAFDPVPGRYTYVRGDGTRAYHPSKVEGFLRDLLWLPRARVLFVLDRVRSADASYGKAWLLHGVSEPKVEGNVTPRPVEQGGTAHGEARVVTFEDGGGRLRVHSVLPLARDVIVRGGPGWEFWTPGDERGGPWGSGKNWPLDPPEGGPLPEDPYLEKMWKTFWGDDLERRSPSNRRAVVPGAWRIEVSPKSAARDDVFLHVLEIGDRGAAPLRLETVAQGKGLAGAVVAGEATVLLSTSGGPLVEGEATLPDVASAVLLLAGLQPGATYDLQLTSAFAPGAPVWRVEAEANDAGVLETPWTGKDGRLRVRLISKGVLRRTPLNPPPLRRPEVGSAAFRFGTRRNT